MQKVQPFDSLKNRDRDANVAMATIGLQALTADQAVAATYTILSDHPDITPTHLETISNALGLAGHMLSREI